MLTEPCDSNMLLHLPDDVFAIVSGFLSPRDVCNLGVCCRSLNAVVASEKIWLIQCEVFGIVPRKDLVEWRKGVSSYKAICRFLLKVQPLIGIWVHQNPELGNVVYVMPGFLSVVGCRIIPQELGPLGIEDGPILWASVFEVIANLDGSTMFFLHGREKGVDYIYPGSVSSIDISCNILLLEVEPGKHKNVSTLLQSKSFVHQSGLELSRKVCRSNSDISRSHSGVGNNEAMITFSKLAFCDRRKLLEATTSQFRQKVSDTVVGPLFPRLRDDEENFQKDLVLLRERRSQLSQMCSEIDYNASSQEAVGSTQLASDDIRVSLDSSRVMPNSLPEEDGGTQCVKRKGLRGHFWNSIKQILGRSNSINGSHPVSKKLTSSSETRQARLQEFLRSSDTVRLTLNASTVKLSSYRAWPNMHDSRFALYKLPLRVPGADQEYAGLWGGTFGWPPGKPSEDKPGKALFFLLLSYEEFQGQQLLIATKILEGTHYVLHPNGSAMFIVNINDPSSEPEPFPWDTDADSLPVNIKHVFTGEGIASGYGFRYPGSKPGSLFVFQNGVIAFIWKESRAVLTLQRLNLQELLKKGERIPSLPPVANFSYLTKSYSNVFAGFPTSSNCLSSPRRGRH